MMTTFIAHKKGIEIYVLLWLTVLCSYLFVGAKVWRQAKTLNSRNAADSLILLVELEDESGSNFIRAKDDYAEMLRQYTRLMESRHPYPLLLVPPFSKNNIMKELKRAAKDLEGELSPGSEADQQKEEARKKIEAASEAIAGFFRKSKPFTDEPSIAFVPKAIPEEIRTAIVESLKESHEKAEMYANDKNMANSEAAQRANRKAIVYLYLARFGYQEIIDQETLRTFRTDLNRAIYYNRLLQQTEAVKIGKDEAGSDYELLDRHSDSEIRRLRLLQTIIDNDIQQAQALLQIACHGGAIPDIQF